MTATWRHLAMLNFEVTPETLEPHLPRGVELDSRGGRSLVSVVGLRFLDTRVRGLGLPGHRNFEQVNLRFYVRRRVEGAWRRGVVFIKEIVPRRTLALVARCVYGENYVALPMRHEIATSGPGARGRGEETSGRRGGDAADLPRERPGLHPLGCGVGHRRLSVRYSWRFEGSAHELRVTTEGAPVRPAPGSEEEFIIERYWGYSRRRSRGTFEFRVEHPPWRIWKAADASLRCDAGRLYGVEFGEALAATPSSTFVAEGSKVAVFGATRLGA